MTSTYITKSGDIEYCYKDSNQKCFDKGETCNSRNGRMACNTGWWLSGWWDRWWGWNGYWGVYGDNLTYLYTEIDAPDEYICGYNRPCFTRVHCDDELTDGVCAYPRIKRCKTYRCVGDFNNYYYNHCSTVNGKDREQRCCKAPSDFSCEEGECDYDYEIVKKEYTIEYELVRPAHSCTERPEYPETHCSNYIPTYNDTCYIHQASCSPQEKCLATGQQPSCVEDTPPDEYELVDTEVGGLSNYLYSYWYWFYSTPGITWDYELDDCDCKCSRCTACDNYDCDFAGYGYGYGYYGWGWGGYFDGIGSDCCGSPGYYTGYSWVGYPINWWGGICPEKQGDGSTKPWYCSEGGDCAQVDDTEEDFDGSLFASGPYTSYTSCREACSDDNKCIPPDRNYTRGLCCDENFKKQIDSIKKDSCSSIGPTYKEKVKKSLCSAGDCATDVVTSYEKQMCTIDNSKFCTTSKVERTRSRKTYSYNPPIPDQAFEIICDSCNPSTNEECQKNPNSKCPSGTEAKVIKIVNNFNPEEIISTASVKMVTVFCKITTKKCEPKTTD